MSARDLRVAIVGAGMMGRNHARAWAATPGVRVAAVADVDRGRAEALAADCGALPLTDYRAAIDRHDVDVISVCVPAYYHPEVTIFAAGHGKHVLCEKPIALTVERAEAMIAAARESDVRLGIGLQLRHLRTTAELRRLMAEATIGRPVMWVYSFANQIRPKVAMHDMLTGNGGPAVDFCPHRFDLWRLAFGSEAVAVQAAGLTLAKARPELSGLPQVAPDTVSLTVRYASGDVGSLAITWGLPPGVNGGTLAEIWGAGGLIVADLDHLRLLTEGGRETTFGPYGQDAMTEAMSLQAQAFVRAVQAGAEPAATGEDGLAALRVSLAAIRSLDSCESVDPRELR